MVVGMDNNTSLLTQASDLIYQATQLINQVRVTAIMQGAEIPGLSPIEDTLYEVLEDKLAAIIGEEA